MERLTINIDENYVPKALCGIDRLGGVDDCDSCSEYCENSAEFCDDCQIQRCFNLLAAYEDTGLTPKEVMQYRKQAESNGWIPCNERLPEDGRDVLVWFEYFRYGTYNRLFQTTGISYTHHGKWSGQVNGESGWHQLSIIAWQPLPKPYQRRSE